MRSLFAPIRYPPAAPKATDQRTQQVILGNSRSGNSSPCSTYDRTLLSFCYLQFLATSPKTRETAMTAAKPLFAMSCFSAIDLFNSSRMVRFLARRLGE